MFKDNFKNIIFDLGGVILTLDYQKTIDEFSRLFTINFNDFFTQYQQLTFFDEFEKGEISAQTFRMNIKQFFKKEVTDQQIDFAWNAMLGTIPQERIDFLLQLKKEKNIYLLSNTNEIHLKAFNSIVKKKKNITNFTSLFNKAYFSHLVKMRKPETKIFDLVIQENRLNPNETLFIDDSPQHIEGAKKIGLHTHLLPKNYSIIDLLCG